MNKEGFTSPNEFGVSYLGNDEKVSLLPHQYEAVRWMIQKEKLNHPFGITGGIISASMGLGKTLMALTLIASDQETPTLIVCSKSVLTVWPGEIEKFFGSSLPYLIVHKEYFPLLNKLSLEMIMKFKIIITTYDVLRGALRNTRTILDILYTDCNDKIIGVRSITKPIVAETIGPLSLFSTSWRRIISDESQAFRNPKTKTFYTMMCLYGKYKWCLSGTPVCNHATDLYSQLRFCGYNYITNPRHFNNYSYNSTYKDRIYSQNYKSAKVSIPSIEHKTVAVELKGREKELYDYYLNKTREMFQGYMVGLISFVCVLAMFIRLRQVCIAGFLVTKESKRRYEKNHKITEEEEKIDTVLDKMTEGLASWIHDINGDAGITSLKIQSIIKVINEITSQNRKVLVFSTFKSALDLLIKALKKNNPSVCFSMIDGDVTGRDRELEILKFRTSPQIMILFMTYKTGSEGLNLSEADNVIMVEPWWCPAVHEQAIARSHRMGQQNPVTVWSIVISGSIEERILDVCHNKYSLIDTMLGELNTMKKNSRIDKYTLARILGVSTVPSDKVIQGLCSSPQIGNSSSENDI